MRLKNNIQLFLLALGLVGGLLGCTGQPQVRIGHHLSSQEDVFRIADVVFIELNNEQCSRDIALQMSDSVLLEVQRRDLFLTRSVYRSNPIFEKIDLPDREPLSLAQIKRLRELLKCDAVIFGTVSHFRPPPGMQIRLYLNMVDLREGKLIWGVNHIWDTTNKPTEERIERFFSKEMRSGYGPAKWRMGLLSPMMFGKFVAHEAAGTLPLRISQP